MQIDEIETLSKHYQRLSDREAFVTAEMVRNAYQGIGTEYETLLRAFDKENGNHLFNIGNLDSINKRILFIPRNGILCPPFFGIFSFSAFGIKKTSRSLEALRLQPLGEPPQCFQWY